MTFIHVLFPLLLSISVFHYCGHDESCPIDGPCVFDQYWSEDSEDPDTDY